MDKERVKAVLNGNKRFQDPYTDPESYYIWNYDNDIKELQVDDSMIELYFEKLKYAVENADVLIKSAFKDEFFDFYGVNKNLAVSPEKMCSKLIFGSFVLSLCDKAVYANLENQEFMFGHFIAVKWDWNFHVLDAGIC